MEDKRRRITFVIGGARSGKSGFALSCASAVPGRKAYIATAQALDDEMKERIRRHREERPGEWETHEEPLDIAALIKNIGGDYDVILIDCLTLWTSNLLLSGEDMERRFASLHSSLNACGAALFIVSNEVGSGIVPDTPLSRRFRDLAGSLNQKVAGIADDVYLVTAGIPLKIK